MVHYIFNSSTAWKKGIIIRYCQHCNTDLVGVFDLDLFDGRTSGETKNRDDVLNFFNSKNCPICGSQFCDKTGYNFSNGYLTYLSKNNLGFRYNVDDSGKTNYGYFYIRDMLAIEYDCFADQTVKNLSKGEKIMTEYGRGTVDAQHTHNSRVLVKFYDKGNIDSILSYLKQFRIEDQKNAINTKYENFIEECDSKSKN